MSPVSGRRHPDAVLAGRFWRRSLFADHPARRAGDLFGAFVTTTDMGSGAPTFGTPEAAQITYGAGQLARRLGLPYRSGGSSTAPKIPDAQAGYETANSLNVAPARGSELHAARLRWLEGGLVASFGEIPLLDAAFRASPSRPPPPPPPPHER